MTVVDEARNATRARIVAAGAELLHEHGPDALTTRRVAERAGVQQPTIYRAFGDKDGLLDAVAEHVMAGFAAGKAQEVQAAVAAEIDPMQDLRAGWRAMIAFGLENPTLFRLLSDPARVGRSPAARAGREVLERRVHRLAGLGRLGVSESRAVLLIQAAGVGVIQTLLSTAPEDRDPALADDMFAAVLARIRPDGEQVSGGPTTDDDPRASEDEAALTAAVTMRALAPGLTALTPAERVLLGDWLQRVIDAG